MKREIILTIFMSLFLGFEAFGTAQEPDWIFYRGRYYFLYTNPLEVYLKTYPDKRPKADCESTSLWRGYIASYKIENNQLFLKDISVEMSDTSGIDDSDNYGSGINWKNVLGEVFPGCHEVKVDWFTGLLVLPFGQRINCLHMGYGSTYENYILLEIKNGDLIKERRYSYEEYLKFKERQFLKL